MKVEVDLSKEEIDKLDAITKDLGLRYRARTIRFLINDAYESYKAEMKRLIMADMEERP